MQMNDSDNFPYGDAELLLNDKVQRLLDDFAEVFELRITFFTADGIDVRRGKFLKNCDYCRRIQESPAAFAQCCSMDRKQRERALSANRMLCYRCHAGLCEAVAPVRKGGQLLGFLMIGQFRDSDEMPPECVCDPVLAKAWIRLPKIEGKKKDSMLGLFQTMIDYIVLRELAAIRRDQLRVDVEHYLRTHLADENLKMTDMARKIGKSVSSISQFLRRGGEGGFKEKLIEMRLERAEELWRANPELNIKETAGAVGFKDPFYFSRVFRQKRGLPPAEYRNRIFGKVPRISLENMEKLEFLPKNTENNPEKV